DAAVAFFTQALGFTEKIRWGEGDGRAIMLDTGDGNYLELFAGGSGAEGETEPITHLALRTDDCDAAARRAREGGAEITMEPKSLDIPSDPPTPVRIAFCKAPGGVVVEFFQNDRT
ncbi:MAG: VOC family protein, partial [Phycisphaeraceae bacterium]